MDPRTTIAAFDAFLAARGRQAELIVVGGAALALLGVVMRPTRDCDVLLPPLDADLADLARVFARVRTAAGHPLDQAWLNNGPASLAQALPEGWRGRLQVVFQGASLRLQTLGRRDLLAAKLWALCDRGTDLGDCLALRPTAEEIAALHPWLLAQDIGPQWPEHVAAVLTDLGRRSGHGV